MHDGCWQRDTFSLEYVTKGKSVRVQMIREGPNKTCRIPLPNIMLLQSSQPFLHHKQLSEQVTRIMPQMNKVNRGGGGGVINRGVSLSPVYTPLPRDKHFAELVRACRMYSTNEPKSQTLSERFPRPRLQHL